MVIKMKKRINDVDVNYVNYGKKDAESTLVYLHGWGQNIAMMKPIADPFDEEFNIVIIDLPGFGESSEPTHVWTLDEYVDCVKEILDSLEIDNPILLGHSFGGKISLMYASKYQVKKLVLFGSPFKKEIKKDSLKLKILKSLKKVPGINKLEGFAKKHIGSTDYKNASEIMRKIMVEHVNLDITEEVKKIKCPTLIVWGTLDDAVPIERAHELEELIEDAGLVVYDGCTHYAYLERLNQTVNVLWNFL
jgi:pimeloyl-ACP methyl ester carboxylesterase